MGASPGGCGGCLQDMRGPRRVHLTCARALRERACGGCDGRAVKDRLDPVTGPLNRLRIRHITDEQLGAFG